MTVIVDASYGHAQITPSALKKIGATGAILYAGCNDPGKNCTKAELHALLEAGFQVGLVIENGAQDLAGGAPVGAAQGKAIATAAKTLGYDGVLYTAADWNSRGADLDQIDAAMKAFGEHVGQPGLYGNSYALDRCAQSGAAAYLWQSNSTSFSAGVSSSAHLLQRYNDPRAKGLPVDINDVQRTPLGLMGADMPLTPADLAAVNKIVAGQFTRFYASVDAKGVLHDHAIAYWLNQANAPLLAQINTLTAQVTALTTELEAVKSAQVTVTPTDVPITGTVHIGGTP